MKLRADFVIEIEVPDFVTAAEHQRRLETFLADMREQYEEVRFCFTERRTRTPGGGGPERRSSATGRLNQYEDD